MICRYFRPIEPLSLTTKREFTGSGSMLKVMNPAHLLGNLKVTSNGDTDTVSGQVQVRRLLTTMLPLTGASVTGAERAQLTAVASSFKTAQGSLSVDRSTHLPTAFAAQLKLVFAHALSEGGAAVREPFRYGEVLVAFVSDPEGHQIELIGPA